MVNLPVLLLAGLGLVFTFHRYPITCLMFGPEVFRGRALEYLFIACIVSYVFLGYHGVWPSQKTYGPKSRLLNIPSGETAATLKKGKDNQAN